MFDLQDALRRQDVKELEIHLGPDWMEIAYLRAWNEGYDTGYEDGYDTADSNRGPL